MVNPSEYSRNMNISRTFVRRLIDEFEEEIKCMSGKCMDIGCGPGDITKDILLPALDAKAVITGTDISESMITHAKKVYGDEIRLNFDILDIETKELPKKYISQYNHAFTFHVLHWCQDIRQAIENIYQLLRTGGTVLALTVASHDVFDILHKLSQDVRYKSYIKKELKTLLKSIGFNVLHCSHRERTLLAEDIHQFSPMILSFVTQYLENMPHERMKQFKNDFSQEYTRRRFVYKCTRGRNERIISDLHEILVFYAQKE
ncbi:juvenile hormone acid O-methyltransferase isoform X2 [Harpegnathos saltator]|uniref:juvenile hormone acid O-methyltransferase-like isoform X2 n=1 Tax=Harpegnathos saltator TaxID=610380 RepID=UPI000DBED770|nr:juvenile hormone acid O-methyltransferase-like isoform X2 [Harpegnathos saltator]XP_025157493.1 juvenile hormone acid O-methyltransferase-like isoform X2 [Harpegnathos saltator]XP_025157494.1 juvenile hormone acid O-methyltransferase isoform X2 [Harpegnathos saltator]